MSTSRYPDRLRVRSLDNASIGVWAPRMRRDDVLIDISRGTGYSYPATLSDVSRLIVWLVGVVGRQPDVEDYGNRTPTEGPMLTLLSPGEGMRHGDTISLADNGESDTVTIHIRHHSPGQQQITARFGRWALEPLLDWLAAAHMQMAEQARERAAAGR